MKVWDMIRIIKGKSTSPIKYPTLNNTPQLFLVTVPQITTQKNLKDTKPYAK
jgi:hypothetical protein